MARLVGAGSDVCVATDVLAGAHGSDSAVAIAVFERFDVVRVRATPDTSQQEIAGLEGPVLGTSQGGTGEILAYAVPLYGRDGSYWSLAPSELKATGRHDHHENVDDGPPSRVSPRAEDR
jgi:hypothetical protein